MNVGNRSMVVKVLTHIGKTKCAYGFDAKFCDCKYHSHQDINNLELHYKMAESPFKKPWYPSGGSEVTGHCELMTASAILNELTDDEYDLLSKRVNKYVPSEKPYRIVFHYNKAHNEDQSIPPWIVKSKGKTYYVHHFTSQVGFSTKETPENPHTKGSLQCVGFLHINQEGDSVVATVKEFPVYDQTKTIPRVSDLS